MNTLFADYPYFWSSLAMAILAVVVIVASRHREQLLVAGGIGTLFAVFSFEFIPWYWDPKVFIHYVTSPSDMIFCFATGTLVWWLATLPMNGRLQVNSTPLRCLGRALAFALPGVALAYSIGLTVMNHLPLQTTLIGLSVMGLIFLGLKRAFWPMVLPSTIGYTVSHLLILKVSFFFWPKFADAWNMDVQPDYSILGIPAYEVFWAVVYGFAFPLYMLFVFNAKLQPAMKGSGQKTEVT